MNYRKPSQRFVRALALEPRILLDAAAVSTATAVAQQVDATTDAPGVTATPVEAEVTITDTTSSFNAVDLFRNVAVSLETSSTDALDTLVITVDSSGTNQALVIDGSTISLVAGSGETADSAYYYSVAVSGGTTTISISLASGDASASATQNLIDSIAYKPLDTSVENSTVTVTLKSLSDAGGQTTVLDVASRITIVNDINVAPVLTDSSNLEAAESFTIDSLGDDEQVIYSGDGSHAYVAGDGAISVFSVDDSGRLTLLDTITVAGMGTATQMAASADGASIYVIDGSSSVYIFNVNDDGALIHQGTVNTADNGDATGGLAVSEDGTYVYVGTQWNDVVIFERDTTTGTLIYFGRAPGESGSSSRNGVIATSGNYVFVIYTTGDHNILVYQRNQDGSLSTVASLLTGVFGYSAVDYSLALSADAQYLYIADPDNNTLSVYQFSDSNLSLVETISLSGISSVALSEDGKLLYATTTAGAINVYTVGSDGVLTFLSSVVNDSGISDIAVSSDGLSLVVAGNGDVTRYTLAQTLNLGVATSFAAGVTLKDTNYSALANGQGNYNGASITVSASVSGGSFGFSAGNGLSFENGAITLDGTAIATLSVSNGVLSVTFTADTTTAVANQVLQQLTYTNASAAAGSYIALSLVARDAALSSDAVTITLRVNSAPALDTRVATGYKLTTATSETAYSFTLYSGLFSDADGDNLTWSVNGLPEGLSFDAATRTISGSALEAGTFSVTVTVTDAAGSSASLTLELVVEQIANRAPEINAGADTTLDTFTEGESGSVTLDSNLFTDADSLYGDSLTWAVSGLPEGLSFNAATLTISGTSSTVADYPLTVTVTDASGASTTTQVTLRVITEAEANNSAPLLDAADSALVYTAEGGLSGYSYGVQDLELSADDSTLIVVGNTTLAHAVTATGTAYITIYSRDATTGALTLIQTLVQGSVDDGDAANGQEVDGLANATAVTYSADGSQAYIAGRNAAGNYVITTFNVNADGTLSASGLSTVVGAQVKAITLASDGNALYVVSASTVYSFAVSDDGALTLAGSYAAASSNTYGVAVDNRGYVYVSSGTYLMVFSANQNGTLQQLVSTSSGLSLSTFVRTLAVTDEGYIFLATGTSNTVVTVYFDSENNTLTKVASASAGGQVWGLNLSADGTTLYVGNNTGSLLVYAINDNGSLALVKTVTGIGARAYRIEVSSDGSSIYAGGFFTAGGLGIISTSNTVTASYTESATAQPFTALSLSDADYDALQDGTGNYNGATISVVRDGGSNAADTYGFSDGNGLTYSDGVIALDGTAIATLTNENGVLSIVFTADVSTATANQVLQQITYTNTSSRPGSSITLLVSVGDQYTSSSMELQLAVTQINDAPSVETSGKDVTYVAGSSNPVKLFSDSEVSAGEDDQAISSLTLTVSGLLDGTAEKLVIGSAEVTLANGTSVSGYIQVGTGDDSVAYIYTVSVSVDGNGVATVTITSGSGLPVAVANALLDSIGYINTSFYESDDPSLGTRTVTLASITDTGGTSNGGVDTSTLAISATANISLSNIAPSLTATGATSTYTENGEAVSLFSDVTLSTGEQGQGISEITLTVAGLADGVNETLMIDGTRVSLVAGSGQTASGLYYTVSVDGGTATVEVQGNLTVSATTALLAGVSYANLSEDPTIGTRTITLSEVQDDGGTYNSGDDTANLSISATVTVMAVNDAPRLSSSTNTAVYTVTGSAASLFSDTTVDTVESDQTITAITLTVSGVSDGANETLTINGTRIILIEGSGTAGGYSYTVTVDANSSLVTVTLASADGIAAADAAALIDSITYANLSNTYTAGERAFTLSVQDSGGSDTSTLASTAVLNLVDNSAPVLGSTPDKETLETIETLTSISGLSDVVASALSGDGSMLYAVSSNGAIAVFSLAENGELVYLETLASGLDDVSDIQISADGNTVYVLGEDGDAIAIFNRDGSDGGLTLAQTLTTENVTAFTVAEDGSAIYVVDGNYSGLKVYTHNGGSGDYVLSQTITASTASAPYLFTGVGIVAQGDYVYVITDPASTALASTLIVYQRASDGTLSATAYLQDGAADSAGHTVSLTDAQSVTVSSDGGTIYVASVNSVAIFSFDATTGTLTYTGAITDLSSVTTLALASDDDTLYVISSDGSISRYDVRDNDPVLLQTLTSTPLAGAADVTVANDGAVVVAGSGGLVNLRDGLSGNIEMAYTEQGSLLIAANLTLSDADYDALNNEVGDYNGAVITVVRETGANGDDHYGFENGNGLTYRDGVIYRDGEAIATFATSGGALTVTFSAEVSSAVANQVLQQISYSNSSDAPDSSVSLVLSVTDGYDASTSVILRLSVTALNDAPTISSTGNSIAYSASGDAVKVFSATVIDTLESGQTVTALTLIVAGISDDTEQLVIDGTAITLLDGVLGATARGYTYSVTVENGVATVALTLGGSGIGADTAMTLVDAIAYQNVSESVSTGERSITLASVQDSGGTASGGVDTTVTTIKGTVTVINSAPQRSDTDYTLSAATAGEDYTIELPADLFSDADGDTLTWSVQGLPNGLSFDAGTRTLFGSAPAKAGTYSITIIAEDTHGASVSRTLSLVVMPSDSTLPELKTGFQQQGFALPGYRFDAPSFDAPLFEQPNERIAAETAQVTAKAPTLQTLLRNGTNNGLGETRETLREQLINADLVLSDSVYSDARGSFALDGNILRGSVDLTNTTAPSISLQLPVEPGTRITQSNGLPLPSSMSFDVRTGELRIDRERLQRDGVLRLTLITRDAEGKEHRTALEIHVEGVLPRSTEREQAPTAQVESLSERLRQNTSSALLSEALDLLDQLSDLAAEPAAATRHIA